MSVRVLLADRENIIRQGVRILLEREGVTVVGEAANLDQAALLAVKLRPQVVVLEGYRPDRESLEATRRLTQACPWMRAVILTHAAPWANVDAALQVGIRGYVLTSQLACELAEAIRRVAGGSTYFSPSGQLPAPSVRSAWEDDEDDEDLLTPHERRVLQFIAEGLSTTEIAGILQRSARTADAHRAHLMETLDVHHVAGLVRFAIRRGLIDA